MLNLTDAAVSRSESDWLVGINGTRAMTAFNSLGGGFQLTPVGRVQTPTLAILSERELKIRDFTPRDFWEVYADFGIASGKYRGRWFDETFKKSDDEAAKAERLWDRARAEEIVAKCQGKLGTIEEEKSPAQRIAPQLYDLTTLQREANSRFGISARRTLQIAQALYEKYKVLTYPRTDSRYLPEDYLGTVKTTLTKLDAPLSQHAQRALDSGWVRPNKRIFNNAKISDHFAIIPTGVSPERLEEFERKVYDMVASRFVAVFFPAAQFEVTQRITRIDEHAFLSKGKIVLDPGWLAVYGKQSDDDTPTLCPVAAGETADTLALEIKDNVTRPPARYNEATLLSAMEGAGKLVDDEDLREAMSQRGLGTPATRAQIIEGLIFDGYVLRQGRDLIVAQKGLSLIALLHAIGIESLASPEMTGEWEYKLKQMEAGTYPRAQFMNEIQNVTREIVTKAKDSQDGTVVSAEFKDLEAPCPKCSATLFKESYKAYECSEKCGVIIWKNMAGRELERSEVVALLRDGRVGPLEGFRSKLGRPFAAPIVLTPAPDFKQTFDFGDTAAAQDFSTLPVIYEVCPVCQKGKIHDTGASYQCANTSDCKFRTGKVLCQREVPPEQVVKLLAEGKTDLIKNFISKKGKPFSAFLKLDGAKVGFEFEPRGTGEGSKAGGSTFRKKSFAKKKE